MLASPDEKEVRSITPTQRIIKIAGVAGSQIAAVVIGATLPGPLAATGANSGRSTQLAAASASPSVAAGTFKSNEATAHEAGESATVEAQENSGQRPGGGSGTFTPNENATHEQSERAARQAQGNAGQPPTAPSGFPCRQLPSPAIAGEGQGWEPSRCPRRRWAPASSQAAAVPGPCRST